MFAPQPTEILKWGSNSNSGAHLEANDVGVALLVERHERVHRIGAAVAAADEQLRLGVRELLFHLRDIAQNSAGNRFFNALCPF